MQDALNPREEADLTMNSNSQAPIPQQKGQTMRSKLRWLLALGAIVALALTRVGVRQRRRAPARAAASSASGEFAPPTAAPDDAKKGGDLTVHRGLRRRLHRPRRRLLPVHLHGRPRRPSAASRRARRTTSRSRRPTLADRARRRSRTTARRSPTRSATASSSRPPVEPRRSTAADVKYAIERALLPGVAERLRRRPTWPASTGFDEAIKAAAGGPDRRRSRHQRDHDAGRHDAGDQARQTRASLGVIGGADAAGQRSGSGGVREGVRRREPVDLRRASGRDRPVHDRDDELRLRPNKEIHLVRNPNWEASDADFRPAYLDDDQHPGGLRRHRLGRQEDPHGERPGQRRLLARRRACSSRRRPQVTRTS